MPETLTCGAWLIRVILLVLNSIFVLLGIVLIALGIYVKVDDDFSSVLDELAKISSFEAQSLGYLSFILIGGGIFTLLISLTGLLGSFWRNRCLLYSYIITLGILMILELVGFILAFAYKAKLESVYQRNLKEVFIDALVKNKTQVLNAFHDLENKIKCCGVNGIDDYKMWQQPPAWCFIHIKGCANVIISSLEKNLPMIGSILGVLLLIEIFTLIGSIILARALRNAPDPDGLQNGNEGTSILMPNRRRNYYRIPK